MRTKQQKQKRVAYQERKSSKPVGGVSPMALSARGGISKVGQVKRSVSGGKHSIQEGGRFWNREYKAGDHFSLSESEGADLKKFMRFMRREQDHLDVTTMSFMDVGCGNGRNSVYLAREFGMKGVGFDIAESAIDTARQLGRGLPIKFYVHNLGEPDLAEPDLSCDLVLDMMVSHCLNKAERQNYRSEILRVLRPGGFMFVKTFLREGDEHAKRMIREHPAGEPGSYIHPMIGILEHTWGEEEFREFWGDDFRVHLLHRSHGYQRWGGQPYKRRYMVVYLERINE